MQKVAEIVTDHKMARKVSIYVCHRYGEVKLKDVGKVFGIGDSAVSLVSARLVAEVARDKELDKLLATVKKELDL